MRIVSTNGSVTVNVHGKTYRPDKGGVFEVPEDTGRELVGFPQWEDETTHLARMRAERKARDADPATFADRLTALEDAVAALSRRRRS